MKKKVTLILVRHGIIEANVSGRYIGCRTDEGLCEEGIREISEKKEGILRIVPEGARVFSGPMKRALQTEELIFDGIRPVIIDRFTEIDFGEFEGKTAEELSDDKRYIRWIESGGTVAFPGGESRDDLIARTMEGFREVTGRMEDGDSAVIVCHGGNIMALMGTLTDREYFDFQVENLGGYLLNLTFDDERILDITYDRVGGRDSA